MACAKCRVQVHKKCYTDWNGEELFAVLLPHLQVISIIIMMLTVRCP
jgi:hypothetical protein